ncbi:hypothetical protein FS749_012211 [Ceratobasidium sp. UAMH 11750]|nr:hypothetical protein FS749_012211 [Ceratobasidium sp. UAMH 11750]
MTSLSPYRVINSVDQAPDAEKDQRRSPPNREVKAVRDVRPPLHNVNLSTIIYALVGLGLLWAALSAYRVAQLKADAGGWYNLALGKRPDTGAPIKGNIGGHGTHDTSVKGIEDWNTSTRRRIGYSPVRVRLSHSSNTAFGLCDEHISCGQRDAHGGCGDWRSGG